MLVLSKGKQEEIFRYCEKHYPYECCGIFVGRQEGEVREALEVRFVANQNRESPRTRYDIDPLEFLKIDREARKSGRSVVGFFHSHPDHPAAPSEFDRSRAWSGYSYLVVSVENGKFGTARSWTLLAEKAEFQEEQLSESPPRMSP